MALPQRGSGFHPDDPDYTEGRGLYVAAAERDARSRLGYVHMRIVLSILLLTICSNVEAKAGYKGSVGYDMHCLGVGFSDCPPRWRQAPRFWFNRYIHRYWDAHF